MIRCHKCEADVHPVKAMGTVRDSGGHGSELVFSSGSTYNQCPICSGALPPDVISDETDARESVRPTPRPAARPTQKRSGNIIEDARIELAEVDAEIASLATELTLKKAHRRGLMSIVTSYDKAVRSAQSKAAMQ